MFRKILCILCVAFLIVMTGCKNGDSKSVSGEHDSGLDENDRLNYVSTPIEYSFPEFLESTDDISIFSRMIFWNMDRCNIAVSSDEQPVDGFYCDLSFSSGRLYRYQYNGLYGIVDSEGNIKLEASYSSVIQIRPDLFELVTADQTTYASIDEKFNIEIVEDDSFDWVFKENQITLSRTQIQTEDVSGDNKNTAKYTLKTADGNYIYQASFDSVAELSKDEYDFDCEHIYNAYLNGSNYLIVVDKYYNYRVYEGNYATVEVNIDNRNGSCYVLSYDHYIQLSSLTDSFKHTETQKNDKPVSDFVRIIFGDSDESDEIIIYADGYCVETAFDVSANQVVAVYSTVDREAFADIVDWIDTTLSTEYVTEKE